MHPAAHMDNPCHTQCFIAEETGDEIPDVGEDYTLLSPASLRGRIAFGAIPWLMHDHPFVQGLSECAEIGKAMAKAAGNPASGVRRKLPFMEF